MTLGEALGRLMQLDPRYSLTEAGGVLLIRPIAAWNDRRNFLNRTFAGLNLEDQRMGDALDAIQAEMQGRRPGRRTELPYSTPEGDRRFSVTTGATSVLGALNATAREHGALGWVVKYCQPQPLYEFAEISLWTFDRGNRSTVGVAQGPDGKWYLPCMPGAGK